MILLTPDLHDRLLSHYRPGYIYHVPVIKFFNPLGALRFDPFPLSPRRPRFGRR
jgi:hypothetical protein